MAVSNHDRDVLVLIALAGLLRVYGAVMLGLGVDESYTVAVTRLASWSFVDHPPLGFMLARWSADLFGSEAALVLRLPYLALFAGSTWLLYRLTARLFTPRAGFWAAAWFSVAPFFALSAGSWIVPDGPLVFFLLLAAMLVAPLMLEGEPDHIWPRWLGVGAALGLALLSKYHGFLFGFGGLLFLLTTTRGRRWLAHPAPYAAGVLALVFFVPVIIWNAQHDWASLAFQGGRAGPNSSFTLIKGLSNFARLQLGQLVYLLPGPFLAGLWLLWRTLGKGPKPDAAWLMAMLALPPVLLINLLAPLSTNTLPHWSMPGFLFAFPLIGAWIDETWEPGNRFLRRNFMAGAGFLAALVIIGPAHINSGLLTNAFFKTPPKWDDTALVMDWDRLGLALEKRGWLARKDVHLVARNWIDAGKLDRAVRGRLPLKVLARDKHHFAYLPDPEKTGKRTGLFIRMVRPGEEKPGYRTMQKTLPAGSRNKIITPPIDLMRGGKIYRRFLLMSTRSQ